MVVGSLDIKNELEDSICLKKFISLFLLIKREDLNL